MTDHLWFIIYTRSVGESSQFVTFVWRSSGFVRLSFALAGIEETITVRPYLCGPEERLQISYPKRQAITVFFTIG